MEQRGVVAHSLSTEEKRRFNSGLSHHPALLGVGAGLL